MSRIAEKNSWNLTDVLTQQIRLTDGLMPMLTDVSTPKIHRMVALMAMLTDASTPKIHLMVALMLYSDYNYR
jgi:hypothetical protein